MANGVGHRQHGQAEGQGHADEGDAEPRKPGGQHGTAAAAQDEPEGADKLGSL